MTMQQKSVKIATDFLNKYSNYDINLINDFYDLKFTDKDIIDFNNFFKVMQLKADNLSSKAISVKTSLPKSSIEKWIFNASAPPIIQIIKYHRRLIKTRSIGKWLSINSTRGGKLIGPWINISDTISSYRDILVMLEQIELSTVTYRKAKEFNIDLVKYRALLFAYLLGIMLGDASKHGIKRRNRVTRRIQLALTKAHETNKQIGNFTTLCAGSIGLRMTRIKDMPAGKKNTKSFYRWTSQSSLLIQWIFDVCMGLNNNQTTTYDKVKMDWLLKTPKEFRIWFLQGLADSDGYVDFNSFQVGIISQPNSDLIKSIMESLGVRCSVKTFREGNLEAVIISVEDAYKIPLFNPIVNSYRYLQMKTLATAEKLHWHIPEELSNKIKDYLNSGFRGSVLIKNLLETENIRVRPKTIRRIEKSLKGDKIE